MQQYSCKYNKQAILLVNLGTPDSYDTKSIKRYLKEFLSDPRVIEANPVLWKIILNLIILPIRAKKMFILIKLFGINNITNLHYYSTQKI